MQALQLGDWPLFVGSNSQAIIEVPIELYSGVGKGDTGSQMYVLWPALLKEELVHIYRRDLLLVENWMLIKKYMTCSQEVLDSHGFQTSHFLKCMSFLHH